MELHLALRQCIDSWILIVFQSLPMPRGGSTGGTFKGEHYFFCSGHVFFVALDNLSELSPEEQTQSIDVPRSQRYVRLEIRSGDRVVAFAHGGLVIYGTVRWLGQYSLGKPFPSVEAVGIETVSIARAVYKC